MTQASSPRLLSRRSLLAGVAATGVAPSAGLAPRAPAAPRPRADDLAAPGWRRDVLIRWGDRVEFDAPRFDPRAPTDAAAATQFGWDAVVLGAIPQPVAADGIPRVVLGVGHPTVEARMMFPGGRDRPLLAGLAQGASLLNLERRGDRWLVADGGFQARRLTSRTLCRFAGPLAGVLGEAVQGVLGVGAGCATPWGSLLLAEGDPLPWFERLSGADEIYADRNALALYGWMVDLDPLDPQAVPVKRSALGRFVRGGVAAGVAVDGRAVVFMTDARPGGMLLRFISAGPATNPLPGANRGLLDAGTLSVACADGTGLRFVDLPDTPAARAGALDAAAMAGGAIFDRPAGLALALDGSLTLTCRGNPARVEPDPLNPRPGNGSGHVLVLHPEGDDPAAAIWSTEFLLLGGDPAQGGGVYPEGSRSWLTAPAAVAATPGGALWIATGRAAGTGTGLYLAAAAGHALSNPYLAPRGASMGGVATMGETVFSAVRHPGAEPGASFDRPATRWPTLRPDLPPQTTVVALSRAV